MTASDILPTLMHATDRLDWAAVRDCFAESVDVDYSELTGSVQGEVLVDDLLEQWQALLPGFLATQHLLGPVTTRVDAGHTVVDTHVRAWHYLPDEEPWVVAGHYEARVDTENRISALKLRVFHLGGPTDAPARAIARAITNPRP